MSQESKGTEQIQFSEKEISLLCDLATSFHTIRNMDEMFAVIFREIQKVFDVEGASLALHDPATKEFYFLRTITGETEPPDQADLGLRFPDNKGIAGWVRQHSCPALSNDVTTDARFFNEMDAKGGFCTKSMICVPLQTRKGFLGVLYALNKQHGQFSEREEKLLEILSGTLAVSLENARLYGELKDHLYAVEQEKNLLLSQVRSSYGFQEIIGSSQPMQRMFELMRKVIESTTTVLIQGETGTGKELIAKVIHYNGPLQHKPFVVENCAALPEHLLESELFGHVKGAFTGALANKKGLFELAHGGTIFLDEIGEMSVSMQVKLLRVLQDGQFRPVGGTQVRTVDVRLIAATNRNLKEEMEQGRFRRDLYYRINVFQIIPPPLRERKEDILALAQYFLAKYARKNQKVVPTLSPQALDLLVHFDWPGNVRELENEMERALTMSEGKCITADCLSDKFRPVLPPGQLLATGEETLKDVVQRVEQVMISNALETTGGNRSKAARSLGLSRQGLLNKMAAYGLSNKQGDN